MDPPLEKSVEVPVFASLRSAARRSVGDAIEGVRACALPARCLRWLRWLQRACMLAPRRDKY
jgi:hypothetical protein